jgi:hypothetical protein
MLTNQLRPEGRGRIDVQRFARRHPHRLASRLQRRQHRDHATVTPKESRISQGLKASPSTCTRTNSMDTVRLTPASRYLTSTLLIGRANSHPTQADKGPFAHEQEKERRPTHRWPA